MIGTQQVFSEIAAAINRLVPGANAYVECEPSPELSVYASFRVTGFAQPVVYVIRPNDKKWAATVHRFLRGPVIGEIATNLSVNFQNAEAIATAILIREIRPNPRPA